MRRTGGCGTSSTGGSHGDHPGFALFDGDLGFALDAGSKEAHIVMSDQDHPHGDQQFFGGVDWGGSFHQLCVLNTSGALVLQQRINHDVAGRRLLAARIADLGALVSVAIERGRGAAGGVLAYFADGQVVLRVAQDFSAGQGTLPVVGVEVGHLRCVRAR
jgi:hypothetical protein